VASSAETDDQRHHRRPAPHVGRVPQRLKSVPSAASGGVDGARLSRARLDIADFNLLAHPAASGGDSQLHRLAARRGDRSLAASGGGDGDGPAASESGTGGRCVAPSSPWHRALQQPSATPGSPPLLWQPIVAVGKHLCGAATDLALACLERSLGTKDGGVVAPPGGRAAARPFLHAIAIATCCHHRCEWRHYVGRGFVRQVLVSQSMRESQSMRVSDDQSGWAIGAVDSGYVLTPVPSPFYCVCRAPRRSTSR
jgi:hypothetical protein